MEEGGIHISSKNLRYLIFGVIIIALLAVGYVVMNSGDKTGTDDTTNIPPTETPITETPTTNDIPVVENTDKVVILSDTMDINKANERRKSIFGRVQNTGTTRALNVWITATLYDLNGTLIGTETTRPFINELNPDEVSYFQVNIYDSYDKSTAAYRLSVISE